MTSQTNKFFEELATQLLPHLIFIQEDKEETYY